MRASHLPSLTLSLVLHKMGTTCRLPHWEEVVTHGQDDALGAVSPAHVAPEIGLQALRRWRPLAPRARLWTFKGLTAGVLFRPISGVPGQRGFLRGCGCRTRGPELRGQDLSPSNPCCRVPEGGAAGSAATALPPAPDPGLRWCRTVTPLSFLLPVPVSPHGGGAGEPFAPESAALC